MPLDMPPFDDAQLVCSRSPGTTDWCVSAGDPGAQRLWPLGATGNTQPLDAVLPAAAARKLGGLLETTAPGRFARTLLAAAPGAARSTAMRVQIARVAENRAVLAFSPMAAERPMMENAHAAMAEVTRQLGEAQRTGVLLRAAVEASPVNLTISDAREPDMPLIYVNDAFCRTTGYARDDVIGRNCRFLQGPDTDPAAIERLRLAVREGRSISVELLNYRRDGQPFWNYLNVAPVHDAAGTVTAYVGVQHDTTEERRAAETERQRQKLEALGKLAGGVAHEINNLLQPALAFPELILDALPETAAEEREWLGLIESHALQARGIVGDILAFARAERGRVAALDATEQINAALDFVQGLVPASVRVRRAGALADGQDVGRFLGSDGELKQILANLVGNAAHAMGLKGAVTVTLAPAATGSALHLDVVDTGTGMDPEVCARIFEPFYTTKGVGQGTGLGLSIVYGIVQRWGGDIQVDSTPGEGTRFTIILPRLPKPSPTAPGAASTE
jgi:PAS domain S-box-containing protein